MIHIKLNLTEWKLGGLNKTKTSPRFCFYQYWKNMFGNNNNQTNDWTGLKNNLDSVYYKETLFFSSNTYSVCSFVLVCLCVSWHPLNHQIIHWLQLFAINIGSMYPSTPGWVLKEINTRLENNDSNYFHT